MGVTADRLLLVQLADWMNRMAQEIPLPCPVHIDAHEDTGESLWIQPLAGTNVTKRYTTGDYIGSIPFAVYYQCTHPRDMAVLDVPLWNLGAYLDANKPELKCAQVYRVEMTSTPSGFYRGKDKTCINQAIFNITYRKGVQTWQ